MAVETRERSNNAFLYFAVGALIVGVGVLGYLFYTAQQEDRRADTAIERTVDAIGDAAKDVGDSARDAARNIPASPAPQPAPAPAAPAAPAPG